MTTHEHLDDNTLQSRAEAGLDPGPALGCAPCEEAVEGYRILFDVLARPAPPAPPGFCGIVMDAVEHRRAARPVTRSALFQAASVGVASAALFLAAFLADVHGLAVSALPSLVGGVSRHVPSPPPLPRPLGREVDGLVEQVGEGVEGAVLALRRAADGRLASGSPILALLAALGLLNAVALWFVRRHAPEKGGLHEACTGHPSANPDPGPERAGRNDGGQP